MIHVRNGWWTYYSHPDQLTRGLCHVAMSHSCPWSTNLCFCQYITSPYVFSVNYRLLKLTPCYFCCWEFKSAVMIHFVIVVLKLLRLFWLRVLPTGISLTQSNGGNNTLPVVFCYAQALLWNPSLYLPSSSYGSRLSRSRCFPPWARWRATCSSASTRPPCTKSWRTRLAGCATYGPSCRSSSWWHATAAEQSAFWTPKSACSSARVRWLCIRGFAYGKLLCNLLRTSLPHKPISFLSQFGIPNKEKHLELVSGTVKLLSCTKRLPRRPPLTS